MQDHPTNTNQKELTDYIVQQFLAIYAEMVPYTIKEHPDVGYLELASDKKMLKILVSTRDNELTIGFSASPGVFAWHTHIPSNKPIDEQIKEVAAIINEIIQGKKGIIFSSVLGYFPGDEEDVGRMKKYRQINEIIERRTWNEL